MTKTQIIKDSLYDYLKERGYSYISERDTWVFRKEEEEIRKEIVIHDMYNYAVRFDFATTVGGKEGIPYMDSSKVRLNDEGFCEYQNEEEFRIIIDEIKRVIVTKGEEIFGEISVISDEKRLRWEMEKQFFENYKKLTEQGSVFLGIKNENGEEKIRLVIKQLKEIAGKNIQEVKEEIFMLAAVYGNVYEKEFEGKWEFNQRLCKIACEGNIIIYPLKRTIFFWNSNNDENYEIMVSNYLYSISESNRVKQKKINEKE